MNSFATNSLGAVSHILLDIEGTTCPVRFVSETLFPYAGEHLESFLQENQAAENVRRLVQDVQSSWRQDADTEAQKLLACQSKDNEVVPYLQWLIRSDRKLTALKDLQGLIWEKGYQTGKLQGPLFRDVAPALQRWQNEGLTLAVYSSGSIQAQQLIYAYSNSGDLRHFFQHWFDTKTGSKLVASSYRSIGDAMAVDHNLILFISDAIDELEAAREAGLQVLHCDRNEEDKANAAAITKARITSVNSFDELTSLPLAVPPYR
jgi:enolase-phosphatase E1